MFAQSKIINFFNWNRNI